MNDVNPIDAGQTELPVPESAPAGAPAADLAATPSLSPAEQLFEVKLGGQSRKVSLAELQSGYQRQQDYTQKTMALAEERRRVETQWTQERQQLREFLTKPENVQQLLQHLQKSQAPQGDPNAPINAQQLHQMLDAERQRIAYSQQAERAQMMQDLEMKQMEDGYKTEVAKHIDSILTQHPELKSIRRIDVILKQSAAEGQPATLEEAKSLMLQAASDQVAAIRAHFTEQQKIAATQKQTLIRGIEPPGGAAPMPQGSKFKMGSPNFNADVADYLRQISGSNNGTS